MSKSKATSWFITGVSSGLGKALCEVLVARGDTVVGTVRKAADQAAIEALAPGLIHALLLDITDEAAIPSVIAQAEQITGGIDVLVNNAGYGLIGAIEEASSAEVRAQFDVNVFGAINVIQAILPYMRRRRAGHIINITSVSGLAAWAGSGVYTASKFALEGIGQTLAQETAQFGINVTNVEPGGLKTEFSGNSLRLTKKEIEDYRTVLGIARQVLADPAKSVPGDAKKAAQAIVTAASSEKPPMHLLLGSDAMQYVEQKQAAFNQDIANWQHLTIGIGLEPDE